LNGYYDIVKYLVSTGSNIHVNSNYPLVISIKNKRFDIAKLFIGDISSYGNHNYAVNFAVYHNHPDIL